MVPTLKQHELIYARWDLSFSLICWSQFNYLLLGGIKELRCYGRPKKQKRREKKKESESMVFIGYSSSGAYKLYNPTTKKVEFSRDVLFEEYSAWKSDNCCSG